MECLVYVAEPPEGVQLSPLVLRNLLAAVGPIKSCVPRRDGTLIVSFAAAPMNVPASVTSNAGVINIRQTQNTSTALKGTVFSPELIGVSEEDMLQELGDQVVDCQALRTRERDSASGRFMLSFAGQVPELVHLVCGLQLAVRAHIPAPLRCRLCHTYGHHHRVCKAPRICPNCGKLWHEDVCTAPPHCVACDGNHPVTSSVCPTWQREQGTKAISFLEKVSFEEARKKYRKLHPDTPPSLRPAAAPPSISSTASFPPVSLQHCQPPTTSSPISFAAALIGATAAPRTTVRAPQCAVESIEPPVIDRLLLALTHLESAIVGQNNILLQLVSQNQRLIDHLIPMDSTRARAMEPSSPGPTTTETFNSTPTSAELKVKRAKRTRAKSTSSASSSRNEGASALPSTQRIDDMFRKAERKATPSAPVAGVAVLPEPPEPLVTVEEEN